MLLKKQSHDDVDIAAVCDEYGIKVYEQIVGHWLTNDVFEENPDQSGWYWEYTGHLAIQKEYGPYGTEEEAYNDAYHHHRLYDYEVDYD